MSLPKQHGVQSANGVSRWHGGNIGLVKFLAILLILPALNATAQYGSVGLAWQPSASPTVAGYLVYYGEASGVYTWSTDVGTNLTATVSALAQGVTYYFAATTYDANGNQSDFSTEVSNSFPFPPSITTQPMSQTVVAGTPVTLSVSVIGGPAFNFQWMNGLAPIAGATASSLSWPQIGTNNAGNYSVVVSNGAGVIFSSVATLTVVAPPLILIQPQSKSVIATTPASLSVQASGNAPLSFQWYDGMTAIAGATNTTLSWASAAASNAGNYNVIVTNAFGVVASSIAVLKVLPTNTIATVAGAYNGLFFQTNVNGTPNITEATAGFLGNCVVASNGAYSTKIYLDGASSVLTGVFSITGSASATISIPGTPWSNLGVALQLDLFNGSQQITGAVSSTTTGNTWTAPLLGYLATNTLPLLSGVNLSLSPGSSINSPTSSGAGTGVVVNGVLSLAGVLGDASVFSQSVPISTGGNVPLYVNLYANGGVLEGWVNLTGSTPLGSLTWIRPAGVLVPAGFPLGFNTVVQVGGSTFNGLTLVLGQTLGPLRNNYSGPVGFRFLCQSNSHCLSLGRWVTSGNSQSHALALCSTSGTVLASATLAASGATAGAYAYVPLATPYAMTAGTAYVLLSQETSGGDQWHDEVAYNINCSSLATNINAEYGTGTLPSSSGTVTQTTGGGNGSYGPLNILYTVP